MRFRVLFTGSDGNCSLLTYKDTNILIDAGFKTNKKMKEILGEILAETKIDGVIITHEHNDHFSPWTGRLCMEYNIPLYVHQRHIEDEPNRKTKYLSNLDKRSGVESFVHFNVIKEDEPFTIKDLRIDPFTAYHDAKKTLGFVINKTFGYLADCGYISNNIKKNLQHVESLALEFNYFTEQLVDSNRHFSNKLRTFDKFGHLSCEEGIKFVKKLREKNKKLKNVITLHPSNSHCDLSKLEDDLLEALYADYSVKIHVSNKEYNEVIIL